MYLKNYPNLFFILRNFFVKNLNLISIFISFFNLNSYWFNLESDFEDSYISFLISIYKFQFPLIIIKEEF